VDYTQKRESGFCLENETMFQIQDMFENGKPNIVLKKVSLKLGTVVLVIVYNIDFYSGYGPGSRNRLSICVRNGTICVSFGTNVPCN